MKAVILAMLLMASSAQAQTLRQSSCAALLEQARPVLRAEGLELEAIRSAVSDGWCVYSAIEGRPRGQQHISYTVDALRLRGKGLQSLANGIGAPGASLPTELEVQVTHMRVVPNTQNPAIDFMMRAQMRRDWIDMSLLIEWDQPSGTVRLHHASATFASGDFLRATAELDGIDLSSLATLRTAPATAKLRAFAIEARNTHGAIFESLLLPALIATFDADLPDADAVGASLRQQAADHLAGLPDSILADGARSALAQVVADFPNPNGTLRVEGHFDGGFGMADAMVLGARSAPADGRVAIPENLTITAVYDREPLSE